MGVRDGEAMVTVQATNELGSLTFNRPLGYRAPMLETSIGLAYLAYCQEAERRAIVLKLRENGRLWKASEHDGQTLGERITEIRARRFAMMETSYSNSQYRGLVWAIAVPILDKERLYGCINLVMLRNAVSIAAVKKSLLKPLEETASRLAAIFQKDWR